MKAALVFDGLGFGGIERVGVNYAKMLLELGYEVDIYNLKPECADMEKECPTECNIIHRSLPYSAIPDYYMLMVKKYRWGKYVYPFAYVGISGMMYARRMFAGKRKKYDVAIAFSGHMRDLTFVAYNFVRATKKMAWLHGALIEYMASSCTYGDLYRKIKNMCVLSMDMHDLAIHVNQFLQDLNFRQMYNPMPKNDRQIDEDLCKSLKEKYGDYILMVGRFEDDKDQKTVIEARKVLKEKYGLTPNVVFVGGGSTLDACKVHAAKLGLTDAIEFTGARYDVQNFYSSAKLFVHSSPVEGLPTVLLEAMQHELPIVATDSPPGVTEILQNDLYGLRCAVGNPENMADAIYKLLSDESLMNHYKNEGKKRLNDFSWETIKGQLSKMLEEI